MEHFIGIDLGTTYSAVSTIDEYGKPIILKNRDGEYLTPSVVYFDPQGTALAGSEAKERMLSGEDNVIMFFKREMGNPEFHFSVYGSDYSATDLSAILLRKLKEDASYALNSEVTKAVITVPAYFNDLQRNETINAAKAAGLEVLRIINEPTAAAISYGITKEVSQRLLVYDLGGGTFDVTVLEVNQGVIRVLSTGGDHSLGGKDWDDCILNYITAQFLKEFGIDPNDDPLTYNELVFNAEKLKMQLSATQSASMLVRYGGHRQKYNITRLKFEELTANLLERTQQKTEEVLKEAGLLWGDLTGALLVGGSTKMPMVEQWVQHMSGRPPLRGINVDEAVCLGAAIQASLEMDRLRQLRGLPGGTSKYCHFSLPGGKRVEVKDVMSHSLGAIAISQAGDRYVNSIIIGKNVTIPVTESRSFKHKTRRNGPNEMEVYLTQGEGTEVSECIVVGRYLISDITHVEHGETIIELQYTYDENGVIHVKGYQHQVQQELVAQKLPLPTDWTWLHQKPKGKGAMDIILAIDVSGSMSGKPLSNAIAAAVEFVEKTNLTTSTLSIVGFTDSVIEYCTSTQDIGVLKKAIKRISAKGGTNSPLEFCYQKLVHAANKPVIVLLTDGEWFDQRFAIATSDKCKEAQIDIVAIGFGAADKKFLDRISTLSVMTDLENLVNSFSTIAQELAQAGNAAGIKRTH